MQKLITNSLSAEYALRITPVVNDSQYLQSSLHWTFPQAYYSALFSARALLTVIGTPISNEELIRRKLGKLVASGFYPDGLNAYAAGTLAKPPNETGAFARVFTLSGEENKNARMVKE